MSRTFLGFLTLFLTLSAARAAQIFLYQTGWEAAPASPAWNLGNVVPQNSWIAFNSPAGHLVVSNGSPDATVSGEKVTTPTGSQFHKFVASTSTTQPVVREAYPDITDAVAALPPTYKIIKASIDIFVPSVEDGVAGLYGLAATHSDGGAPWGVMMDPSDHSVNLLLDGSVSVFVPSSFDLDTWFNVVVTANYLSGQISIAVDGVTIPELTQTSTDIMTGTLTDVDLLAWNYDPSAASLRVAFSDNYRVWAETALAGPTLKLAQNPAGDWTLSWEAVFSDWKVESAPAVNGPWNPESVTPTVSNGVASVVLPNNPPNTFFRLHAP